MSLENPFRKEFGMHVLTNDYLSMRPLFANEKTVADNMDAIIAVKDYFHQQGSDLYTVLLEIANKQYASLEHLLIVAIDACENNKIPLYYQFVTVLAQNELHFNAKQIVGAWLDAEKTLTELALSLNGEDMPEQAPENKTSFLSGLENFR